VAQLPVITPAAMSPETPAPPAPASASPSAPAAAASEPVAAPEPPAAQAGSAPPSAQEIDIFTTIEKLGELKARGLLTEEEFTNKKADLLNRL
jgi:hypothetical protein